MFSEWIVLVLVALVSFVLVFAVVRLIPIHEDVRKIRLLLEAGRPELEKEREKEKPFHPGSLGLD